MNAFSSQRKDMAQGIHSGAVRLQGSAPASGAANDALVVGILRMCASEPVRMLVSRRVRREGAPNGSRGGRAPLCVK
jgi:hypothetical protein